jgi:ABC-type transport system involved in multi-copper enzyme maturation permease subunit
MATPLAEPRWYHVGPHGFFDLVRLARRGRSTLIRVCYILALFAALAVVYHNETTESPFSSRLRVARGEQDKINTNARIAERFSITILIVQNLAVLLLMPIYVAASVHEERDKRTLPMLFTTHLSAREILLGKLVSRMGHVGSVLFAGLPILAIIQLWGGIDMPMIAANFLNTGCLLASVGAVSLMAATRWDSMIIALVKIYLLLAATICCGCLPLHALGIYLSILAPFGDGPDGYLLMWISAGSLTIVHFVLVLFCIWFAARNLEAQRGDEPMRVELFDAYDTPAGVRWRNLPAIRGDALIWKERYVGESIWSTVPVLTLPFLICALLIYMSLCLRALAPVENRTAIRDFHAQFESVMLADAGLYILLVAFRATGCIVRERERQTLDSLLTLPLSPAELLNAKLKGILARYWIWLLPVALVWLELLIFAKGNWRGAIALVLAMTVHLYFFTTLGVFLSVMCRTRTAAYVSMSAVLLSLLIGTVLFPALVYLGAEVEQFLVVLNPVACWTAVAGDWWLQDVGTRFPEILGGMVIYLGAAIALHRIAYWRFARNPG